MFVAIEREHVVSVEFLFFVVGYGLFRIGIVYIRIFKVVEVYAEFVGERVSAVGADAYCGKVRVFARGGRAFVDSGGDAEAVDEY